MSLERPRVTLMVVWRDTQILMSCWQEYFNIWSVHNISERIFFQNMLIFSMLVCNQWFASWREFLQKCYLEPLVNGCLPKPTEIKNVCVVGQIWFLVNFDFTQVDVQFPLSLRARGQKNWESTKVTSKLTWNQIWPVKYICFCNPFTSLPPITFRVEPRLM